MKMSSCGESGETQVSVGGREWGCLIINRSCLVLWENEDRSKAIGDQ